MFACVPRKRKFEDIRGGTASNTPGSNTRQERWIPNDHYSKSRGGRSAEDTVASDLHRFRRRGGTDRKESDAERDTLPKSRIEMTNSSGLVEASSPEDFKGSIGAAGEFHWSGRSLATRSESSGCLLSIGANVAYPMGKLFLFSNRVVGLGGFRELISIESVAWCGELAYAM